MNKNSRSVGIYIVIGMLLLLAIFALRDRFNGRSDMTEQKLYQMLEDGEVSRVEIVQNEEVPTGSLLVTSSDNEVLTVNVTDVNEAKEKIGKYDVTIVTDDVTRRGTIFTYLYPIAMMVLMLFFFMMILSRQSGGGTGSAMSSFG